MFGLPSGKVMKTGDIIKWGFGEHEVLGFDVCSQSEIVPALGWCRGCKDKVVMECKILDTGVVRRFCLGEKTYARHCIVVVASKGVKINKCQEI